jgi:hypothetical protein
VHLYKFELLNHKVKASLFLSQKLTETGKLLVSVAVFAHFILLVSDYCLVLLM